MINLRYTGPLQECGFTGPQTGRIYLARGGEMFEVAPADAPELLRAFPEVLEEVKPTRTRRSEEHDAVSHPDAAES